MDTPARLAGKLIGIDLPGPHLDDETRRYLERYRFGGVCLFRKNVQHRAQVAQLVKDIREVLGPKTWVSIDQEGGAVLRTPDFPEAPSAMALGAAGSPELAAAVGAAVGRGLISMGVNWNYAPSLDVNTNPDNPVIGDRSFGSGPGQVAELGLAWARGLQSAGVAPTVKHFPGHGDTHLDSHLALPRVDKPLEMLEGLELLPFRRAVEAGIPALMTAHILYPALDPRYPATLSKAILSDLLRYEWGYGGVIVTDSMAMKAIADHYPAGQAAVRSVQAGADLVLALGSWETKLQQAEAVRAAVEAGEISTARLEQSLERLEHLEQQFSGVPRPYPAELERQDRALMNEAARHSITAYGEVTRPHPSDPVLLVAPRSATGENVYELGPDAETLALALAPRFPRLRVLAYPKEAPEAVLGELQVQATGSAFLLFGTTARGPLSEGELRLGRSLFALGKPALHLAIWNPYHVRALGQPALLSYGFRAPALAALSQVLAGAPALARLPVGF
jgi:beta-N-acetylhexosaminidase